MPTSKYFLPGVLVFAYLLVGSGQYVAKAYKTDPKQAVKSFAGSLPRKIYRYSVVPGGVATPEELAAARRSDPVVAAHYADFGNNTRVTTLKEDMYVYVSYRKGDKIFFSKKKHKVCKGEVVLTDGKNVALSRCANRISRVFRPPALAFDEPSAPEFDYVDPPSIADVTPGDPVLTSNFYGLPEGPGYVPPVQSAQTGANPGSPSPSYLENAPAPIQPSLLPYAAGASAFILPPPGPTPPVVTVPEPGEWSFFSIPSALFLVFFGKRKLTNLRVSN